MIKKITYIVDLFYINKISYYSYSLFRGLLALSLLLTFMVNDLETLFPIFTDNYTHYESIKTSVQDKTKKGIEKEVVFCDS